MIKVTLQEANPELAKQWNPTKNGNLKPANVTPHSDKKVWWLCGKGHEWQTRVDHRSNGSGCPFCSRKSADRSVDKDKCLAALNPNLAKEWHPTKNGSLTPENVKLYSNKKVWWLCPTNKSHEWQAPIAGRSQGRGCPYCSGRVADKDNCLAAVRPGLAKEWHPTKNGSLTPENVKSYSNQNVWWLCPTNRSHEWQATIANRSKGSGCPYCTGRAADKDNCLAAKNPELAKEWHLTKNGNLTPSNVTSSSHKKVWWLCQKNRSHEWQATIASRNQEHGCPYCHNQISQLELRIYCELKYLFPSTTSKKKLFGHECDIYISEIKAGVEVDGAYWHRNKYKKDKQKSDTIRSKGITLIRARERGLERISDTDIFYSSRDSALAIIKKIVSSLNEQCILDLNRRKTIDQYLQRQSFASESEYKKLWDILPLPLPGLSLVEQNPELAKEWHPTKNGNLTSSNVTPGSQRIVWWLCPKNRSHEWQAPIAGRNQGHGCPYCSGRAVDKGNCLVAMNPALAKQWHPIKNGSLTPENVTLNSGKKVWWLCPKNKSHEWQAAVASRSKGGGCPYCLGKAVDKGNCLAAMNPALAK
jgi:hypothetical protein